MKWIVPAGLILLAISAAPADEGKKAPDGDATNPAKPSLHLIGTTRTGS